MNCSICLHDIEFVDKKTIRCEHVFHKQCIKKCTKCPICRRIIQSEIEDDVVKLLKFIDLETFVQDNTLSIEFLKTFHESFDITKYIILSYTNNRNLIQIFQNISDWDRLSKHIDFTSDELWEFRLFINWNILSRIRIFTISELFTFRHYLNWFYITRSIILSKENINLFYKYLDWNYVTSNVAFTKDELYQYSDWLDWDYITKNINFTKRELWRFRKYLNWEYVSLAYTFTNNELWEFRTYINWYIYTIVNEDYNMDDDLSEFLIECGYI